MNYHENQKFTLNRALHDKMNSIYIFYAMLTFAKSLIGVFVPIYLYKLGYSITHILLNYLIIHAIIMLITMPIATQLIKKVGFKKTILTSIIFYLIHIYSVNLISPEKSILYLYFAAITFGAYVGLFWPAFHAEMAINGSSKKRSSQMGTLQIIAILVSTSAPLIGGIILEATQYFYLYILSSSIIIIGLIPLLKSQDKKIKYFTIKYSDYLTYLKRDKYKQSKFAFTFEGINNVLVLFLWPIIIFIFLKENFFAYGTLITIISFINIIILLYVKKLFDHKNRSKTLHKTSIPLSITWLLKSLIFIMGTAFLYVTEAATKILHTLFENLYTSIFYNNASKIGYMHYIVMREFYLNITKIIFILFLAAILTFTGENLVVLSAIAASGLVSSLGLGMLKEEK